MFNLLWGRTSFVTVLQIAYMWSVAFCSTWPYLQIYPPVNDTDGRTPLYFALVLASGGELVSIGSLAGAQVALDYINSEPSILPGYTLHYTLTDSQCTLSGAHATFFEQVLNKPTKLGWIGSGCSLATEYTAELTPFYNLTQISCVSSLPETDTNNLWKYYFQILPNTDIMAYGYLHMILQFGWKKVSIITHNEPSFVTMMNALKWLLEANDVKYTEELFNDVNTVGDTPYESGARIFIWATYPSHAKSLACQAYKRGLRYPKYQFIVFGWYPESWLSDSPYFTGAVDCSAEERARTLDYSLTVELQDFDLNTTGRTSEELSLNEFLKLAHVKYKSSINSHLGIENMTFTRPDFCYEATLTFSLALHNTLLDIETDTALNMEAGRQAGLSEGERFTLANFSYSNSLIVQRMFHHLSSTDFIAITGRSINFNENQHRIWRTIELGQNRCNGGTNIVHAAIGTVRGAGTNHSTFIIFHETQLWPNGTPTDGLPIVNIVTVNLSISIFLTLLGIIGIAYTLVCIIFNFICRQKKVIRLSSPNLNYIIGIGAIMLYITIILLTISRETKETAVVIPSLGICLNNIGYSLSYGTISSKMIRIWYIFNNPNLRKKFVLKDHHLAGIVTGFVIIDIIILGMYLIIEGVRENHRAILVRSAEHPEAQIGPTAEVHQYFFYTTISTGRFIWYMFLILEKVIVLAIVVFLAIRTRKVKMRGLDDSKFVIASTYATSIFMIPTQISYVLLSRGFLNAFIVIFGGNIFIATTTTLSLVFVPKMIAIYKDPTGENVGSFVHDESRGNVLECAGEDGASVKREKEQVQQQIQQLQTQLGQLREHATRKANTGSEVISRQV